MRVLILADRASDAELAVAELQKNGMNVVWERVQTEAEYLAGLSRAPDLVLADYDLQTMPVLRAFQLLQERRLDTPCIVTGGGLGAEEAVACLQHGAADVLLKDSLGRLAQSVTQALEDRRLRRERVEADAALGAREEGWRQLADELQARVREANVSLQGAAGRLTRLGRFEGEIVATVSHELRTPLNNIQLYLDLLESGKPEKRAHYMATLRREVQIMQDLVEDVLHLARLDFGNVRPVVKPVQASEILMRLAEDRRELARQKDIQLEACLTLNLPPVMADERMLTEVLNNLLTNAINYTPRDGAIRIVGEVREREGRQGVALVVSDTGPGITPEEMPRIFERYYRGEAARGSKAPGTGLGLAIADEIVKRLGGHLDVQSTVGEGSTFTVWLPTLSSDAASTFGQPNRRA